MKMNRANLIEACDFVLARVADKESRREAAYKEYVAECEASWMEHSLPKWREYRDTLSKALRRNGPIRAKDLPYPPNVWSGPYNSKRHFEWKGEVFHADLQHDQSAAAELKKLLELAEDEFVTLAELKSLGYNPRRITGVLQLFESHQASQAAEEKRKLEIAAQETSPDSNDNDEEDVL